MTSARNGNIVFPVTLLLVIVVGVVGYTAYRFLNKPAPNAFMAMAKGQYLVASHYYAEDARAGDPRAQNSLANLYYLGLGVDQDFERAAELYLESAKRGFAAAQVNLGHLYTQGLGVKPDPLRAFGWYNMSNIHGSLISEYYLRQIAVEYTLSPLQISAAREKWARLKTLVDEGL